MFSFFKKKNAVDTASTVHAEVGAPLVRENGFPATPGTAIEPVAGSVRSFSVEGVPPQAALRPKSNVGGTSSAFVAAATGSRPALAFVNMIGSGGRIELWELSAANAFARQRPAQIDPAQASWSNYLVHDLAALPGDLLLVGVRYRVPQVKEGLYLYDAAVGTFSTLTPFATRGRFFEITRPAADTALVLYSTNNTRIAAEHYYPAPTRVLLFSPRHARGITVLELAPKDGSVDRWTVAGKKLWIESTDNRELAAPREFVWSLDLGRLLP